MYEPPVTIITPTYNMVEAGYADDFTLLVGLLDKQTYQEIDHIIVDNASTDETLELMKEYKNQGFLNFYSEKDNGKFDAINKGLLRAKGKYIGILSCNDFYHDITAIADIVQIMEAENADFCFSPAYCITPDNDAFLFKPSIYNVFQVAPCSRQAIFFKKETIEKLGYFDAKFKIMADYDLIIRMILNRCKGVGYDTPIVTYPLGEQASKHPTQVEAECKHIYYKNYKSLYNMTDEVADRLLRLSEIPAPLMEKFAAYFPPEDKELFYERCKIMNDMRIEAEKQKRIEENSNK